MVVYYANKVGLGNGRGHTITSAWSQNAEHPLFAVASQGGCIGIYKDEGDPYDPENEPQIKNNNGADAMCLQWHPLQSILAIGWSDGVLSLWSEAGKRLAEDKATHGRAVSALQWSPDGSRLVTGDESGKVGVWKLDRLRPVPVVQYQEREGRVNHLAFKTSDHAPADDAPCVFYFSLAAPDKGWVVEGDDRGNKAGVVELDGAAAALLYYEHKQAVVALTDACTLVVHGKRDGAWRSIVKVKLPTMEGTSSMRMVWATEHVLASASDKDSMVRLFNLATEENFVLSMGDQNATKKISSLAFNVATNTLAAGTKEGRVSMWQYLGTRRAQLQDGHNPEDDWHLLPGANLNTRVQELVWGPNMRVLGVTCIDSCYVLTKCTLNHTMRQSQCVVQLSADKIVLAPADGSQSRLLECQMQIAGLDVHESHLAVWSGKKAEIYELGRGEPVQASSFASPSTACALYKDSFFRNANSAVEICNLQGTVKQTLRFEESQGRVACLNVSGDFLVAVTHLHFLKMWKVSGREAKAHGPGPGRRMELSGPALGHVESVRVNSVGTLVSFLGSSAENSAKPDSRVVVYDVHTDNFQEYDFGPVHRLPERHQWDAEEARLLAVETRPSGGGGGDRSLAQELLFAETEVATLFSTPDDGLLLQETHQLDAKHDGLVGIHVPNIYVLPKLNSDHAPTQEGLYVEKVVMRQFHGLDNVDDKTRKALLSFSYFLAVGNMDEAYKAVKQIKNPDVWENMVHMCIKTKRLDVAEYCLGNMGHIAGARAIREAAEYKEVDARVATVAVHLGLISDAHKLFVGCERFDLLNKLYQACGEWDKALEVAEQHDRIHLRTTFYNYAKHLESLGDVPAAMAAYEKSHTHRQEIPRMLYESQQLIELERYIMEKEDPELTKWWARYCESTDDLDKALECYTRAGDHLALVRVLCMQGRLDEARDVASESDSAAAAFHMGRQYDHQDNVQDAIHFYSKAHRFGNAIQLAKKHNMDKELMSLALKATQREQIDAATYFAQKDQYDKAVLLYQKGGQVALALELCFNSQLFEPLQVIASELGNDTDPALLKKCAQFFMDHREFAKAVQLLVDAGDHDRALDLAIEHNVLITEEMAEAMTPGKDSLISAEDRKSVLLRIGKCAKRQGSYHLACKKYTQAGDKDKAMKVLLKSGDVDKVIFFAGVSRQKEIYVMAANYLQTLDWHNDAEIMKSIIQFYTKAKAMDSLSTFYESCAQIEIDEYRDYEKALGALRESLKYMQKARSADKEDRVTSLNLRINICERFVSVP